MAAGMGIAESSQAGSAPTADLRVQGVTDLAELLTAFGQPLFALPDVDGGAIHLLKHGEDALVTMHLRLPQEFQAIQNSYLGFQYPLDNLDVNVQVFQSGQPTLVQADNVSGYPETTSLRFERMKMMSLLVVPLSFRCNAGREQKLGVITLFSQRAVLDLQLARRVEAIAERFAALVHVHWRLQQAIERSTAVESMYARIQQFVASITEMNSRNELSEVYELIGTEFIERFHFDMVNIFLAEQDRLVAVHSVFAKPYWRLAPQWESYTSLASYELNAHDGQASLVYVNNKTFLVGDAQSILHLPMSDKDRGTLALLETPRTFLLVPIRFSGKPIGVLALITLGEPLDLPESEMMLIEMLASFISTAIRNAQAQARVEQQSLQIESLNRELHSKVVLLDEIARKDRLTGLNNFGNFEDEIRRRVSECDRAGVDSALSVILFDVDRFKNFNDTWGHPAGNQVLQEVANRILKCSREMDFVARYGGEEFVVVLPQCDLANAYIIAERIRAAIADTGIVIDGREHMVTISGGCAQLLPDENSRDLLCRVDQALYAAKHNGRNRIEQALNQSG